MNLDPIEFQCPHCGRQCKLEPRQRGGSGLHADIRIGQDIRHETPTCAHWEKMMGRDSTAETRAAFLKLATALNRPLEQDPHVSWKEKDPDAKIFSFGAGGAAVKLPESQFTVQYIDVLPSDKSN